MELCQGIRENISTHALTEGDSWPKCTTTISGLFQLTPSRRATVEEAMPVIAWKHISTHALTEGDVPTGKSTGRNGPFQLTPSRRATERRADAADDLDISTHALTEGDSRPQSPDQVRY